MAEDADTDVGFGDIDFGGLDFGGASPSAADVSVDTTDFADVDLSDFVDFDFEGAISDIDIGGIAEDPDADKGLIDRAIDYVSDISYADAAAGLAAVGAGIFGGPAVGGLVGKAVSGLADSFGVGQGKLGDTDISFDPSNVDYSDFAGGEGGGDRPDGEGAGLEAPGGGRNGRDGVAEDDPLDPITDGMTRSEAAEFERSFPHILDVVENWDLEGV